MKKKKSIQKLSVHKETISTLNMIVAGDGGITRTSMTGTPVTKNNTCSCPSTVVILCSSYDDYKC
ncbi:hypothetical protein H2O64_22575 [Kordia sp. YSTF-M3]|uniref:Natural product n=1 Tax=Kordia aestuariivivens TaxID=2759037 RepID=A0ABR7QG59_9FLAO|nr:class I lanthipeptide [Kordia aestuariivivens]MBC8757473.1 hypothetical protein [Kordia aestuariivivens]